MENLNNFNNQSVEENKSSYRISREEEVLKIGFGEPAQNDQIVKDAIIQLDKMEKDNELAGGGIIKLNGPASLPVAIALSHKLSNLFNVVAAFDPKINKYVVAVSHDPDIKPGDLID